MISNSCYLMFSIRNLHPFPQNLDDIDTGEEGQTLMYTTKKESTNKTRYEDEGTSIALNSSDSHEKLESRLHQPS